MTASSAETVVGLNVHLSFGKKITCAAIGFLALGEARCDLLEKVLRDCVPIAYPAPTWLTIVLHLNASHCHSPCRNGMQGNMAKAK